MESAVHYLTFKDSLFLAEKLETADVQIAIFLTDLIIVLKYHLLIA